MELINRYISEIGKHLPQKNRADIETEIRSILEDMLDDRSQAAGRPVDESMTVEVLKAYGKPEKVASTYSPERFLIGPKLYPHFLLILKIVMIVLTIVMLVKMGVAIFEGANTLNSFVDVVGKNIQAYFSSILTAVGSIILVFAILERFVPDARIITSDEKDEEWDPLTLMREPDRDEVKLWEPIVAIFFTLACLVIFNFYPQIINLTLRLNPNSTPVIIPILSDAFFSYLPWLTLLWILEIIMNLFLLRLGHWNLGTRAFSIGLKAFGMGIVIAMVLGPSLLGFNGADLSPLRLDSGTIIKFSPLLDQFVRLALVINIITSGVDILRRLYRLFTRDLHAKPLKVR